VKLFRDHPRLIALFAMLITVIAIRAVVPSRVIDSGSMGSTLPVRTIVFLGSADDLQPRDIITFREKGGDRVTTHTFIGYAEDGSLMTKGDANPTPDVHDPALTMADVEGKVVYALTLYRQIALLLIAGLIIMVVVPSGKKPDEDEQQSTNPRHLARR